MILGPHGATYPFVKVLSAIHCDRVCCISHRPGISPGPKTLDHMSEHQYYKPGQQPSPDSVLCVALWFNAWASPQTPTRVINIPVSIFLTQQLNNSTLKTHLKFNLRKKKMFQYIKGCYRQFFKEGRITSIC